MRFFLAILAYLVSVSMAAPAAEMLCNAVCAFEGWKGVKEIANWFPLTD